MRYLPDKPSLDFLRKEAKDLLAALRESDAPASLADAQRALAREYGLRDWAELKAEAELRTARPPVAPKGLAAALSTAFGLGDVTAPAAPVSFTPMGRCWSITTGNGRWLAVTVYPWITDAQAQVGARLRDAAVTAGVTAPTPVRSPNGRLVESVQGENWRVHEWIEVGPPPVIPAPTAVARGVGAIYGKLHALAIPSDAPVGPYLTSRPADTDWQTLLERARAAHKPWAEQLADAIPGFLDLRTVDAEIDSTELILCNRNLIPENVRVGHDDDLVVTEWDFAGSLTPELELGSALMHWVLRPSINRKAIAAFREGYAGSAGRWPQLDLSAFAIAVTSWLNWTHNTICEAITPTDDDYAAFSDRETTDVLKQPLTRAGLDELLDVTRSSA